jgi:hypothetical protein
MTSGRSVCEITKQLLLLASRASTKEHNKVFRAPFSVYRSEEAKQEQLNWTSDDKDDLDQEQNRMRSHFVATAVAALLLSTLYMLIVPENTSALDRAYFSSCIAIGVSGHHLNRVRLLCAAAEKAGNEVYQMIGRKRGLAGKEHFDEGRRSQGDWSHEPQSSQRNLRNVPLCSVVADIGSMIPNLVRTNRDR